MLLLAKKDLVGYFVELIVVVLGILIAFQVDEWRDDLQIESNRRAALIRLKDETQTNLANCEDFVPRTSRLARSVQMVLKSLQMGQLRNADIGEFEFGLTHIGFLPGHAYLTTVAEEMIAIGLLKELDNADLQTSIASALTQKEILRGNIAAQSRFLQSIIDELARTVEFSYGASSNLGNLTQPKMMGGFEDGIEVTYDFGLLVNNRYLRNLLIETTDGYIDLNRMHYQICASIREIGEQLAEQGID